MRELLETFGLTLEEDIIYYLLQGAEVSQKVKGRIRTKENCPVCKKAYTHIFKLGFICKSCKTQPRRFFIDLFLGGIRYKIYSDVRGHILDSYNLALETLHHINAEIREGSFDPTTYVKADQKKFYISTLTVDYFSTKKDSLAPSNLSTMKNHIRYIKEFFGNKDVREVRKIDIVKFIESLQKKRLGQKTIKNYVTTLKAFLNYLKNTLEIINALPSFPVLDVPEPSFRWLTLEDQAKLLSVVPAEDIGIILFLMLTGCRPSEARALKVKDVDLKNEIIIIKNAFSNSVYREKRKGRNSKPVIMPIHHDLLPILKDIIEQNPFSENFIFINPRTKGPYSQNALTKLWNKIRKNAGLSKDIRLYDATRHSLASNLLKQNVPLARISKLLGHSSVKMTEKYAHADIQSLRYDLDQISIINIKDKKDKTLKKTNE